MFSGIIEEIGTIRSKRKSAEGEILIVEASFAAPELFSIGESCAVDGVCLTAESIENSSFRATLSRETLSKTTLRERKPGEKVNLERALKTGERVGGHFLSGHVDCLGKIIRIPRKNQGCMEISFPPEYRKYIFPQCSIGIDGISLTVSAVTQTRFEVWIIPHTLQHTTLYIKKEGSLVNLETDMMIKAATVQTIPWKKNDKPPLEACI
jgi:riboflavin synthase